MSDLPTSDMCSFYCITGHMARQVYMSVIVERSSFIRHRLSNIAKMYAYQLVTFLVIISLGLISASISNATVEKDSADLSKLSRQIKELSPIVARQFLEASCQMSAECCPQSSSSSVSVTALFNITTLIDQCFSGNHSIESAETYLACTPLMYLTKLATDPELNKLMSIIAVRTSQEKDELPWIIDVCEEKEIYAFVCDWDAYEKHQTCRRKLLKRWTEKYDDQDYRKHVEQRRQTYNDIISELKTAFHSQSFLIDEIHQIKMK